MKSMARVYVTAAVACLMLASAGAQTADVQKLLAEIKSKDKGQLAVSEEDGRFLRVMVARAERSARSRSAARAATAPSGSAWACATPAAGW